MVRRILLVGFMGSGKTVVGRELARLLGWSFLDFDEEIAHRVGLSIPEVFRQHGEPFFREVEAEVGRELLARERVVLASGGGWPAAPGRMETLGKDTLSVWLVVSPGEAVRRSRRQGGGRPLLEGPGVLAEARRLLEEREPAYRLAELHLPTEGAAPDEIAREIVHHLETENRTRPPEAEAPRG